MPRKLPASTALRALSDPVRMRIVECLAEAPRTAKELGGIIGADPNRLYYHLRLLERADIVAVVGAVPRGRSAERRYGLVTPTARIDLREADPAEQEFAVAALLELLRQDFQRLIEAAAERAAAGRPLPQLALRRTVVQLTPDEFESFSSGFKRLCARFARESDGDRAAYSLFFTLLEKP